ncbi:MAG: calcium:proton exchanger [Clostridiales bacterium]|nr:calcium:proton exchanger [Clostridiales bacterium]MCD8223800.1 calcium:proton exchanger [Clostridiales bacterium]
MQKNPKKISYIKKPFATRSRFGLPAVILAAMLSIASVALSVYERGSAGLVVAALGLSGFLFAMVAIYYGATSFLEKEMNYLLARIEVIVGGLLALFWLCMLVVGLAG